MPTQPFQREHLYCFPDRHRVRFLGFGNYGAPLLDCLRHAARTNYERSFDRRRRRASFEEGHSTTSINRFGNGFAPSQVSSFVRVERAGNAHPTGSIPHLLEQGYILSIDSSILMLLALNQEHHWVYNNSNILVKIFVS